MNDIEKRIIAYSLSFLTANYNNEVEEDLGLNEEELETLVIYLKGKLNIKGD